MEITGKFEFEMEGIPTEAWTEISEKVLTLPLYPTLTVKEMDYIIKTIKNCCE